LDAWYRAGPSQRDVGQRHPVLLCPLDALHDPNSSPYSYLMTGGSCIGCGEGVAVMGPPLEPGIRWRDVADGLSTTALFCERRASLLSSPILTNAGVQEICQNDPSRCAWLLARAFGPGEDIPFVQECGNPARRLRGTTVTDPRTYWTGGGRAYMHILPPNMPSCYRGYEFETSHPLTATSHHAGGVNLLLCDGAVKFVNNHVDLSTWWALGTRNGNDVVGDF
jgi:prepilin-type processing-associated H-X9-DG protein